MESSTSNNVHTQRMAISSILSSPPVPEPNANSDSANDLNTDTIMIDNDGISNHFINKDLVPNDFTNELKKANQLKYREEKDAYLHRLKSNLAHMATLDLLALKSDTWDYLNKEEVDFLSKSSTETMELKKLLKQLSAVEIVKKKKPMPKTGKGKANSKIEELKESRGKKGSRGGKGARGRGAKESKEATDDNTEHNENNDNDTKDSKEIKKIGRGSRKRKNSNELEAPPSKPLKIKFQKSNAGLLELAPAPNGKDSEVEETEGKKKPTRRSARSQAEKKEDAPADGKTNSSKKQVKQEETKPSEPKMSLKEMRAIKRQYDNTYFTIWKDLSRKDAPKIHRLIQQATQTKLVNARKSAILCAREAKKWQVRTNKTQKDLQAKARRGMREMFSFWKRNEREERDLRKKAEKEALDKAKKEEDDRESRRQARKLNFLITQTELYSHFIGKKIKTDELEGTADPSKTSAHDGIEAPVDAKKTDVSQIDFDSDNEEEIQRAAAANAQSALLDAKARAQEFNNKPQNDAELKQINIDDDDLNFQNPTSLGDISIDQPKLLSCTLKEYQVKGLNWLANLYDQGINGILADEMGLGKTVQSISVLAYLAETHDIWGPFLVVSPASTLHNWQQEITKFVPDFKVLPYWGSAKDRKVLRKFWDRKQVTYTRDSPFHVLVTSYQLVVADIQYFQRIKWQYMILDEAQAIKSSQSSRWKSLLGLQCRNRLLLTGTPIQNSMQELWALLHFIMPTLFDSHDEFSDWFSKDIESHAQSNTQLNQQQLRRLHVILKPFMLRRIKKNVQSELGDKIEIDVYCDLTTRQQKLYKMLKSQISLIDLIEKVTSGSDDSNQSLINLVMQFRKVCNHPDLFERDDVKNSFSFGKFAETGSFLREGNELEYNYSTSSELQYNLPKLVYRDLLNPNENNEVDTKSHVLNHLLNIWNSKYIDENSEENKSFSWLKFIDTSPSEAAQIARKSILDRSIDLRTYSNDNDDFNDNNDNSDNSDNRFLLVNNKEKVEPFLVKIKETVYHEMYVNVQGSCSRPAASAPPLEIICSDKSFVNDYQDQLFNPKIRQALYPLPLNKQLELMENKVPISQFPKAEMLPAPLNNKIGYNSITMPSMNRFITDSTKLAKLDQLLVELKKNDHRVLIYFQMTKMMDLMEEYLTYRQYKYIRLDGSSKLDDRRDLVSDWQTKPEIFIFLLSTRAGGLGINLTAADTVIFYDSDWNPTIDSQAMDRAHRLGQTRQVTVYRLLVRGTIEERMRDRAKQKEHVQQVVMEGKATTEQENEAVGFQKGPNVALWLLDDEQAANALKNKQAEVEKKKESKAAKRAANTKKPKNVNLEDMYHENEGNFDDSNSRMMTPA